MDVVAGHVVSDYVSGRGRAHARHGRPALLGGSASRISATLASARGAMGLASAYGGAASVGLQLHHGCELPGAPRSRARLAYCMTLEATGSEAMAQAAGRRMLARSATATLGCHMGGAQGQGSAGRMRRRGLPARRRGTCSTQGSGCSRAEEAPSDSLQYRRAAARQEDACYLRQDGKATSTIDSSLDGSPTVDGKFLSPAQARVSAEVSSSSSPSDVVAGPHLLSTHQSTAHAWARSQRSEIWTPSLARRPQSRARA